MLLLLDLLLLLLLLLLLYVFNHVLIRGREAPPYNYVVNTYSRSSSRSNSSSSSSSSICVSIIFGTPFIKVSLNGNRLPFVTKCKELCQTASDHVVQEV